MDNWMSRYSHNGVEYVHDNYNGRTMEAAVYDAIMDMRPRGQYRYTPDTSGVGWIRKKVTFTIDGTTYTGRVNKVSYGTATVKTTDGMLIWVETTDLTKVHP